jgi:hypothetical protein
LYSRVNYTLHTDCEIARAWYDINPNPGDSFEIYLEERFRSFGIVEPGGLFTNPQYSIAIRYSDRDRDRAKIKGYRFLVSRDGAFSSQMSISISLEEWSRGRKITCDDADGETK